MNYLDVNLNASQTRGKCIYDANSDAPDAHFDAQGRKHGNLRTKQSYIILLRKVLDKEMVMFNKPVFAIKKITNWVQVL
jgi:hypothetical protein